MEGPPSKGIGNIVQIYVINAKIEIIPNNHMNTCPHITQIYS